MSNREKFNLMPWNHSDQLIYHIGQVTVGWNDVQFWFYAVFRKMLPDPRAEAIFFAIRTDRAQRDIVRELAENYLSDHPKLLAELKTKIEEANQLAGRRNDVLHAIWNLDPAAAAPEVLLPKKNRMKGKNVLQEINRLNEDLRKLEMALVDITNRVESFVRQKSAKLAQTVVYEAAIKALQPSKKTSKSRAKDQRDRHRGKQ